MERHEFDAAYARICKVCGMKTQTELSAYLGIRQSSISDAKQRMMIPAAWLLTLLTREGVNPAWILTGGGSKFLVPASLPPSAPTLLLARLAGPELEQRIRVLEWDIRLLEEQRKPLYQERRNTSDEEAQAKYSAEIQQQTATLREKRGELRLCRRIQSDIPRVSQQCQQAQAERQENLKKKEEHEHEYQR